MERPSFHETFFQMIETLRQRSTCLRAQYAAILVRDNVILATGYNGVPRGFPHCEECIKDKLDLPHGSTYPCPVVHAEANAIINAARSGVSTIGADLYVNGFPCQHCAAAIVNAGIARVIFILNEEFGMPPESLEVLKHGGVRLFRYVEGRLQPVEYPQDV
ncbi:MAG TPA: cytidine deaminase [Armatimonadetes bacterium]|nr:cytidine deaminase [Armatimonadota bacterium]